MLLARAKGECFDDVFPDVLAGIPSYYEGEAENDNEPRFTAPPVVAAAAAAATAEAAAESKRERKGRAPKKEAPPVIDVEPTPEPAAPPDEPPPLELEPEVEPEGDVELPDSVAPIAEKLPDDAPEKMKRFFADLYKTQDPDAGMTKILETYQPWSKTADGKPWAPMLHAAYVARKSDLQIRAARTS
jgi:hypothetical protein